MMKKLLTMMLFASTLLITGCGDNSCYTMLENVDSLTEADLVDSACTVMEKVEKNHKIKDGKERAYYNLLKYQLGFRLRYKNMKDTIIDYSISYYSKHTDNRKLALAYYLKGRINGRNNNKEAIRCFKKAEFLAEDTNNDSLKMRICNNIAIINGNNEDYKAALKYALTAVKYGKNVADKETLLSCYFTLSGIYANLGMPDSCNFYATKCLDFLKDASVSQKANIYLNVAASIEETDTARAKEYALESIELNPSNNAYQILAKIARDGKDYRLSEEYLNAALKYSKSVDWEAFILYELAQTKELMGQHEEANKLSRRVIKLRDSVEAIKARDSIREIQIAYEAEDESQEEIEAKEDETVFVGVGLSLVVVTVVAVFVEKRRRLHKTMARQREEHCKAMAQMETEKNEQAMKMKVAAKEIKEANKKIERQQQRLKAKTERQRQQDSDTYREGFAIYNKVKSEEGKINWDKDSVKSFITFYRSTSADFKAATDGKYQKLTDYQYTLLALKDMGMDNKQIAATLGITVSAVRTQLSRMKKTVEETVGNPYPEV